MAKSIFSGLKDADITGDGGNYERAGHYYMLINKCKTGTSRKKRDFAAVEKTVVHVLDDNDGLGHRLGEDVTYMVMADNDYFASDICKFIGAVMNMDPHDVAEDDAGAIFADEADTKHDQPFAGLVVECNNREVAKKNSEGTFTKVKHVRQVPASELLETLDAKVIARYFPNDVLEQIAAQEG